MNYETEHLMDESEQSEEGENGKFSLTDIAIAHFRDVLTDPQASPAQKSQAAAELARIDRHKDEGSDGSLSGMSRQELIAEIARIKGIIAAGDPTSA